MPWEIVPDHSECPVSRPWAVVKTDDRSVAGCHPTEADAGRQLAALNAAEEEETEGESAGQELANMASGVVDAIVPAGDVTFQEDGEGEEQEDCPPGQHRMPDGSCMPDEDMPGFDLSGPFQGWTGTLAVEGVETGDGREFAPESLEWPTPPLPLLWQRESIPNHERSVVVGRIDRVERQGSEIVGWGVIDLGSEAGAEIARQIREDLAGGVSVDVDSVKESDVEMVFPSDEDSDERVEPEDDIIMLFGPPPEKVVFHRGRIRGATLVALPAFVEARLRLIDDIEIEMALAARQFSAIGSHETGSSDAEWDAGANATRLPSPMSVETARNAYAWMAEGAVEDGQVRKTDLRFLHHNISQDGQPGAANLAALSNAIGVLNGARGGTTIPTSDRQGVYNHLAAHLRDAGREPPPLFDTHQAVVAAGGPMYPPTEWFQNPGLHAPTPWTVNKDGRVFGHLALWHSCHTTFPDRCVTPPREQDYPYFMKRELETDDGSMVGTGQITMGTGHASLRLGAVPAAAHYDDTGTAMVDVAVGEDKWGIWVAGALRPGVTDLQLRELRGASLSGDWRRIGSKLRLVAILAVNVPGYPVPRTRASLAAEQVASLVAAGIPTEARRERYRHMNAETLPDGTIRVRRASMVAGDRS